MVGRKRLKGMEAAPVLAALLSAALSGGPAAAQAPAPARIVYLIGTLRVSGAWVEAAPESAGASVYLVVDNRGGAPEQLTGGSLAGSPAVPTTAEGAPTDGLTVPPGGTLRLGPGGPLLRVAGWHADPASGAAPLRGTLRFSRSGTLNLSFATQPPQATGAAPAPQRAIDLSR